jgi:hypothetical protein
VEIDQGRLAVWSDIGQPKQRRLQGQMEADDDDGEDAETRRTAFTTASSHREFAHA